MHTSILGEEIQTKFKRLEASQQEGGRPGPSTSLHPQRGGHQGLEDGTRLAPPIPLTLKIGIYLLIDRLAEKRCAACTSLPVAHAYAIVRRVLSGKRGLGRNFK